MRFTTFAGAMLLLMLAACSQNKPSAIAYEALPSQGDPARGAEIFNLPINGAPQCSACHIPGLTTGASPDLTGFSAVAGERVPGESAREYTFYAITEPGRFITPGYGNAMYNQYDTKLSPQDIADLIAYLLEE